MNQRKKSPILPLFLFILLFSLGMCEPKKPTESNDGSIHNTSPKLFILLNRELRSILSDIESERWYNERFERPKAVFKATDSVFTFDSDSLFIELKPSQRRKLNNYLTAQEAEFRKILSGMDSVDNFLAVKMRKIEEYYLMKDSSMTHRKDSSLFLKLKNGSLKELKNPNGGDGARRFFYQGFLKEIGYYSIFTFNYEGASYRLYNQHTGKELHINGILNPSPNEQYWVCTPYDLGVFYNSPNLNLWIKGKEKLLRLFEWENRSSGNSGFEEVPWRTEWIDEQTLLIETRNLNKLVREGDEARFFELKIIQKKK